MDKELKTICYIDASNIRHSADLNYLIDYEKVSDFLKNKGVDEICYFGALFVGDYFHKHNYKKNDYIDIDKLEKYLEEEFEKDNHKKRVEELEKSKKELKMVKKLRYLGYRVYIKPLKIIYGKRKADCDVNIAVEAEKEITKIKKLVLISGDGDLLPLLRDFSENKKEILLLSFGDNTAKELKKFIGGNWVNLSTLKHKLQFLK